jgi:PAP2 superfamily C-terminal
MIFFKQIFNRHRNFWTRAHRISLLKILILFAMALLFQHFADLYVGHVTGVAVGDLILSHIPTFDIDFFVVQGVLILTVIILGLLVWKPRYLLFTGIAISVFILTRSFFISLTHLGVDPHEIVLDTHTFGFGIYNLLYNSKSDFFFSGHTGVPFLMGLIFWEEKRWRWTFFIISTIFGACVLLGHIHYSIDVFAAPFMTYGIFTIAQKLFPYAYSLTRKHSDSVASELII